MESFKLLLMLAFFIANPCDVIAKAIDCKADVEFVLDHSSSIKSPANLNEMWKFVRQVVEKYPLTSEGMHAGVVVFSDNAEVMMTFEGRTSTSTFIKDFNSKTKNYYAGGETYINKALQLAEKELFKKNHRKDVKKYIVLITDGGQSGTTALKKKKNLKNLYNIAAALRNKKKVTILGFGIGPQFKKLNNPEQLEIITGDNDYLVEDFDVLDEFLKNVNFDCGKTCIDEKFKKEADVGFLIDSSKRAGNYFDREREIVKLIVRAFKRGGHRAGLISYSSAVNKEIELKDYKTVEKFNKEVSDLKMQGEKPRLDTALKSANSLFTSGKTKDDKLLFVLTDGYFSRKEEVEKAIKQVKRLKETGVRPFFIAMGDNPTIFPNLNLLAGHYSKIHKVNNKADLMKKKQVILDDVCGEGYKCTKVNN